MVSLVKKRAFKPPPLVDNTSEVQWTTVKLSEVLARQLRLEASVFDIAGKHARQLLKQGRWQVVPLIGSNGLATAYHRPRFKRIFVKKSNYPIYQPSQITHIYPKPHRFISGKTNTNIDALRVKQDQILISCSGTIGKCTIVSQTLNNHIFSHDLLRVTALSPTDTGYIYAFLKTKIGQTLIKTNNYGAVIQHIEPHHLANIPIPNPLPILKIAIHNLIMDSFQLRDESNTLLDKAEQLLIETLNLPPLSTFNPSYLGGGQLQAFNVKASQFDGRLEGSYHLPIVNKLLTHLQTHAAEVTTLGDSRISKAIVLPGRFKRVYVEEGQGVAFIGGKQLLELDPSHKKYLSLMHHGDRIKEQLYLKENMVVVTCSGTIGKVNILPQHWENWTLNQHVMRILPLSTSLAGYVYAWLNSEYGYQLITRFTYGSVVDEIHHHHLAKVQIPLLKNKARQQEINDLVLLANQKRYEAYTLEQEAIDMINKRVIYTT